MTGFKSKREMAQEDDDIQDYKREWVSLTDKELDDLHRVLKIRLMGTFEIKDMYRAIEAKLKEKNI